MINIMSNNLIIIKQFIKCDYLLRCMILSNISIHIDDLAKQNIIHHTIRYKYMNKVNKVMHSLNNLYKQITQNTNDIYNDININENVTIQILKMLSNNAILDKDYKSEIKSNDFVNAIECIGINNYELYSMLFFERNSNGANIDKNDISISQYIKTLFKSIDKEILSIFKKMGSKNIGDLFSLIVGSNYRNIMKIDKNLISLCTSLNKAKKKSSKAMHNSSALLDILIQYFVPIEMVYYEKINKKINTTILINKYNLDIEVNSEESEIFKYEVLLDNCYKITLKCANTKKIFVFIGFFIRDVANVLSLSYHINYNYIYQKKKMLIDDCNNQCIKYSNIDKSFCDNYLANLSIGDILAYKSNDLITIMISDYNTYIRSSNTDFKKIMDDFVSGNLRKKFTIIKVLLFGDHRSINYASLLFNMTKYLNRGSKNNYCYVSDIIYCNLCFSSQNKIRKTANNIKQELENINKKTSDDIDYKEQCLLNENIPINVKKSILMKLEEIKMNNNDYYKNMMYIKTLLDYPWIPTKYIDKFSLLGSTNESCRSVLDKIKIEFDKIVYGQTEFKGAIVEIVSKWFINPNGSSKAIGLCGPPGCGKTLIASSLGKVLDIPYQEIHLGGLEDGTVLNGHSFTYTGAQHGLIISKMVSAKSPRTILFFDELDKTCARSGINEIFNVLIHATDPNTNANFSDNFFQNVSFPLNKCIFIFSFNDESLIDPILLERMDVIHVSPYSVNDKIKITSDYIVPDLFNNLQFKNSNNEAIKIQIKPSNVEYIINNYTLEAGVRRLKSCIEKIFLKINVDRIYNKGPFKNINVEIKNDNNILDNKNKNKNKSKIIEINKNYIIKYLGKPKIQCEKIHELNQIGVVNGLYATNYGSGGIVPILCYPTKNSNLKFTIEITGKQGKVMKESVSFAWTIAKNCVNSDIVKKFYNDNKGGIHIHTPDGAVSKDGPSAGVAFTTAFISRLTSYPIKHDIAMTGEISTGGDIIAIGGLEYKLIGAKIAGIKLVFVSEKNFDDIMKIKESTPNLFCIMNPLNIEQVDNYLNQLNKKDKSLNNPKLDFKVMIVNTIYDIIPYALIDKQYIKETYYNDNVDNIDNDIDFTRTIKSYQKTCDWTKIMSKSDYGYN